MTIAQQISQATTISVHRIDKALELLNSGNTVPFIARYRKEMTGSLDEEQLRDIQKEYERISHLDERRQKILETLKADGNLTPDLQKNLELATSLTALEDLYQPFKKKRKTRADKAREIGLKPLAEWILNQPGTCDAALKWARDFEKEKGLSEDEIWQGARDIVAETINEYPQLRGKVREKALKWARLQVVKVTSSDDEKGLFSAYYQFNQIITRVQPHQVLAINRGEKEGILKVSFDIAERDWKPLATSFFPGKRLHRLFDELDKAMEDAAQRLLLPAIGRDLRNHLTETAQGQAIRVFARNLESLLMQPPLKGCPVIGLDPGFRTGCKVAVVGPNGELIETGTIYPHQPQAREEEALSSLAALVERHAVQLISIGNGTASRETEKLVIRLIKDFGFSDLRYLITSEAGASVYSASPLARQELPELDVSLRGAVSIARRVLDPLAELVKIDPQSIGVGMYQHDLKEKDLKESLGHVVESVVNRVGVHVNTASPALLRHVSGVGPALANEIVKFREKEGPFQSREKLKKVKGMGTKAFEQCAGFLRIQGGSEPLDASAIHPECYEATQDLLSLAGIDHFVPGDHLKEKMKAFLTNKKPDVLAGRLGMGVPTLKDILSQLIQPGRDPRDDIPAPVLRSDVMEMKDLKPGMVLTGTVRNPVDFGAFIDIGVKQDGLLHRSRIPRSMQLTAGQIIDVTVLDVDLDRKRISLGLADDS